MRTSMHTITHHGLRACAFTWSLLLTVCCSAIRGREIPARILDQIELPPIKLALAYESRPMALILGGTAEKLTSLRRRLDDTDDTLEQAKYLVEMAGLTEDAQQAREWAERAGRYARDRLTADPGNPSAQLVRADVYALLQEKRPAWELLVDIWRDYPLQCHPVFARLIQLADPLDEAQTLHVEAWYLAGMQEFRRLFEDARYRNDADVWFHYAEFLEAWIYYRYTRSRVTGQTPQQGKPPTAMFQALSASHAIPPLEEACRLNPANVAWRAKLLDEKQRVLFFAGMADVARQLSGQAANEQDTLLTKLNQFLQTFRENREKEIAACKDALESLVPEQRKTSPAYLENMILYSVLLGDIDTMVKQTERLASGTPHSARACRALFTAYAMQGDIRSEAFWEQRGPKLLAIFRELTRKHPTAEDLVILCKIQKKLGEHQAARVTADSLVRSHADHWISWATHAAVLLLDGQYARASDDLEKAVHFQTHDRETKAKLFAQQALCLWAGGRNGPAYRAAQHARLLQPDLPLVSSLDTLAELKRQPAPPVHLPWRKLADLALDDNDEPSVALGSLFVASQWLETPSGEASADAMMYLDLMAGELRARIAEVADPDEKIGVMSRYLYDELEMRYEFDIERPDSHFLPEVLATGSGNCLGMSALYLALGEKLNLPLRPVCLPSHVFVRFDNGRRVINIETGKKGRPLEDQAYIDRYHPPASLIRDNRLLPVTKRIFLSRMLNNLGGLHLLAGRRSRAIEAFQWATIIDEKAAESYHNLGTAWLFDLDKARPKIHMDIKIRESGAALIPIMAMDPREALRAVDAPNITRAGSAFEKALECDPSFMPSHVQLGLVRFLQHDLVNARRHFMTAVRQDTGYMDLLVMIAKQETSAQQYAAAARDYRQALQEQPDNVALLHELGTVLIAMEDLDGAQQVLERAYRILPAHLEIARTLALLYRLRGSDRAERIIRQIERIDPKAAAEFNKS